MRPSLSIIQCNLSSWKNLKVFTASRTAAAASTSTKFYILFACNREKRNFAFKCGGEESKRVKARSLLSDSSLSLSAAKQTHKTAQFRPNRSSHRFASSRFFRFFVTSDGEILNTGMNLKVKVVGSERKVPFLKSSTSK